MFDRSEFVTYFEAEQHLESRLQATPDEIAQWVSDGAEQGGLNAYVINQYCNEPTVFSYHPKDFLDDDDYKTPLLRLYFLPGEITQFQPAKRYIARLALIERWSKPCNGEAQAISFIDARTKESRLTEYHPISGVVESEGDLFRSGLFDLNEVQQIELEWFKAITDSELLIERRKAIAQIKASRATKSKISNQELLDNHLSDLIKESGLQNAEEFDYSFNLYVWKDQLANEQKTIKQSDYKDKKDYDDRIKALTLKIKEIERYLDGYPAIESAAQTPTLDYGGPELSPSDAVGLYQALKLLGNDWTAEQFALQVFYGGIRAFKKDNHESQKLSPVTNIQDWLRNHGKAEAFMGEQNHVDLILQDFQYSKPELSKFKPNFCESAFKFDQCQHW